jgi:hypothetical protein
VARIFYGFVSKGQRRQDAHGPIRVMAVAEGYAMVRRPHASPFILPVRTVETIPMAPTGPLKGRGL